MTLHVMDVFGVDPEVAILHDLNSVFNDIGHNGRAPALGVSGVGRKSRRLLRYSPQMHHEGPATRSPGPVG
jgi:hypothetical protein